MTQREVFDAPKPEEAKGGSYWRPEGVREVEEGLHPLIRGLSLGGTQTSPTVNNLTSLSSCSTISYKWSPLAEPNKKLKSVRDPDYTVCRGQPMGPWSSDAKVWRRNCEYSGEMEIKLHSALPWFSLTTPLKISHILVEEIKSQSGRVTAQV